MNRFKLWNKWRKNCLNSSLHKFLVLLGMVVSPTFEQFRALENIKSENPDWPFVTRYMGKFHYKNEEENDD